jgi:DnaJ family protein C protein 7
VLFLTNHIPQAIQHVESALRYDQEFKPAIQLRRRAKAIDKLKEEGNASFKSARYGEAVNKYTETLGAIGQHADEGEGGQLRALVLGNRATALSKVR